jgi:20S proteasome alpha/beta subunit
MTIIAIRDGVVAADGAVFCQHVIDATNIKKISRAPDGALGACAGPSGVCLWFRNLFQNSTEYQRTPGNVFVADLKTLLGDDSFQAIWLEPTGEIRRMRENGLVSGCGETMAAVGTSEEFAMGAMCAGASAEEAVRLCIEHTVYAAGEVQVEKLNQAEIAEQEVEGPADMVDHTGEADDGWPAGPWPVEPAKPDPNLWKDKQGLK